MEAAPERRKTVTVLFCDVSGSTALGERLETEAVREVMLRNGDAARPMWATEMGWNVNPADTPEQRFGRVTPTLQARYTVRGFERARQQWPWLDVLSVWYWKRPDEAHRGEDWYWFRLADPDFALQPVYYALRDYAATQ